MTISYLSEITQRFKEVRELTHTICEPLCLEDYVPKPVEFVSPPKWYLAHTTWFFEEFILKAFVQDYKVFHEDFSYLFNSYYNTVGKRVLRTNRGNLTRPVLARVLEYREYVDRHVYLLIQSSFTEEIKQLFEIGINHEQQHQELLLTDIKYILGHNPLFPIYDPDSAFVNTINSISGWVSVSSGLFEIGATKNGFAYDNEYGKHQVYLGDFQINKALVTNAEYLEFMNDGGYMRHELWLDEGWDWIKKGNVKSPLYWHEQNGDWFNYTLAGFQKVNPNALLCHV